MALSFDTTKGLAAKLAKTVAVVGICLADLGHLPAQSPASRGRWPMFGGTPQRNMVNLVDKNIPTTWDIEEGKKKNIKWIADLGNQSHGSPVVANGVVYVGANNALGDKAVLIAFGESDGHFLWQIDHNVPAGHFKGLCSTPAVDEEGIFYVTPGAEVVRADADGVIVWTYDMRKELNVRPHDYANCSPLIFGRLLMIASGNGRTPNGVLPFPAAPSFIALKKSTGKLVWQSSLPGENLIEGQWASPALAVVAGKPQVIFPGGDGVLYSFEPETGKLIWKFDCHAGLANRNRLVPINYFVATPVVHGDRLYIGTGVGREVGHSPRSSHLLCIDVTKTGDVSPKNLDAKDPANKDSALVWSYGGPIEPRPKRGPLVRFSPTASACAVHDGLVYAAEERGLLHCLDAKTGERYWFDDLATAVYGSPLYVDGKVLIAGEDGRVLVFAHGKTKKLLNTIDHSDRIDSSPIVANGVLYVATQSKLIAVAEKK